MRIRALDSIRGLLLLHMTLDHFGRPLSYYLYQCFGFFSAAEGFFFLSGFVGMLAATSKQAKDPSQIWMSRRAARIWVYHMVTLVVMAFSAKYFLHHIAKYFSMLYQHTSEAAVWSMLLINTPEWLDVLPLYVVFLLIGSLVFPYFIRAKSRTDVVMLWFTSFAFWIAAQYGLREAINSNFPSWINHGFFDPFGWQFLYFTGAAVVAWYKKGPLTIPPKAKQRCKYLVPPAVGLFLIFCFLWSHQFIPIHLPNNMLIAKESVGPLRLVNFLAFVYIIYFVVKTWPNLLDFRPTTTIGQHSLDVYSLHIVLVYLWMSTPGSIRYSAPWNVIAPIAACFLLWVLAKARKNPHTGRETKKTKRIPRIERNTGKTTRVQRITTKTKKIPRI
ncbi:MAG: OpgC domain-containing protein [Fibrobacteraceae bacterium]|nr:OpgC domain-containing protein [Fibrobacteraceae bacterium]